VKISDRIYGQNEIQQPVLLDLLQSRAMARLRGVLQHGVTALIGITRPVSRFEHSVGVMLLVRRLGAGLDEQIAALLHDISHTAFSHVVDYVFNNHCEQSYHEEQKEPFMAASDLPEILARHGYDWRAFLHEDNYPLLEQPAPALCADRLDYFLRDSLDLGLAEPAQIQAVLPHLKVAGGRIVVDDLASALWMADTYMAADEASWSNFREVGLYELTAQAIRQALRLDVLAEADLMTTDSQVWQRLQLCSEPQVQAPLGLVSASTLFIWDDDHPDFRVGTKLRTIDPDVQVHGTLERLSKLDVSYARRREAYLARKSGDWPMRVVRK
jgi:uncharacterized protein